jgi:hypothetical protein
LFLFHSFVTNGQKRTKKTCFRLHGSNKIKLPVLSVKYQAKFYRILTDVCISLDVYILLDIVETGIWIRHIPTNHARPKREFVLLDQVFKIILNIADIHTIVYMASKLASLQLHLEPKAAAILSIIFFNLASLST